jgi:hypothetical protein
MSTQNSGGTLTQRIILSSAFDPMDPMATANTAWPADPGPAFGIRTVTDSSGNTGNIAGRSSSHHWQDTVADGLMGNATASANATGPNMGNPSQNELANSATAGNEFELDVESLTHTFQTQTQPMPMPGVAKVSGGASHSNVQMVALVIDLGMMREVISVQGVLIDRVTHPSSTSGHHIRKQSLLDIARGQWARVHNMNRTTGDSWQNPNRVPALTIGPMHGRIADGLIDGSGIGRDSAGVQISRDHGYYGDEPSDDPRGHEFQAVSADCGDALEWDWTFDYRGRRRYRGLIRRLTLTQVAGQPDVWRYTFDFEIIKNELQLRLAQT